MPKDTSNQYDKRTQEELKPNRHSTSPEKRHVLSKSTDSEPLTPQAKWQKAFNELCEKALEDKTRFEEAGIWRRDGQRNDVVTAFMVGVDGQNNQYDHVNDPLINRNTQYDHINRALFAGAMEGWYSRNYAQHEIYMAAYPQVASAWSHIHAYLYNVHNEEGRTSQRQHDNAITQIASSIATLKDSKRTYPGLDYSALEAMLGSLD